MATAWDDSLRFDPDIATAMGASPCQNGEIARGQWPITADVLRIAALAGLPPACGVACELSTTARAVVFTAPPFATRARIWLYASGADDIDITAVSGCTGAATVSVATETSPSKESAAIFEAADLLTITAGDACRNVTFEISRASTDVQCYAIGLIWGGFAL